MIINKVLRRLKREYKEHLLFKFKKFEFRDNPYNRLDKVQEGLTDQQFQYIDDKNILDRIIKAYQLAKEVQKTKSSTYNVSNEWLPIYEKPLKPIMNALSSGNVDEVRKIYRNFWRNSSSVGLVGFPGDMEKSYFKGKISKRDKKVYLYDFLHRMKYWKSYVGNSYSLKDLKSPAIGNPFGLVLDGTFIKSGADYLHYYSVAISRLIKKKKNPVVVELGAGYGGMPYYLCRDNPTFTYVDFDLPENLALTSYFLMCAFPEKKFALYGENELNNECLSSNNIILMPSFEIEKMPTQSTDLAFNSYSLAEMSEETIKNYIYHFDRVTKEYILHINHTRNSLVGADNFEIDNNNFELVYKIPAIWNGGRDLDMDEFEYLYRRTSFNSANQ